MAGKARNISNKKTLSLKTIEEHLDRQDKEIAKSHWLTFAAFGAAVALVGVSAWLARIPNITIGDYAFFMLVGLAIMGMALWGVSRIGKEDKKLKKQNKKINLSAWLYFAIAVGLPVFLVGFAGFVGVRIASNPTIAAIYWLIVAFVGLAIILAVAVKAVCYNVRITKK
jgi:cytochrome b561